MKRTALLSTFSLAALLLCCAVPVSAESRTSVNVNSNTGGNTVCVNGECTTSDGNSKSTVCVNGKCWDSADGNVDYQSEDGNTKVNITNNKETVSVQQSNNEKSETNVTVNNDVKDIEPTIKQEVKAAQDKLQARRDEAEKKIEEVSKEFDIMSFIRAEFEEIRKIFTLDFIFGKN